MQTNYILHLNNSFKRFTAEEKATPFHISLYMALFQKWNSAKFRNPISIARDDIMHLSKIGSANTYSKCLKELHAWGYIKYVPSHSYHVGSKIYMYTFNTINSTTSNKTTDNASDISPNKTTTKTLAQDVRPYKNSNKQLNKTNKVNEQAHNNNPEPVFSEKEISYPNSQNKANVSNSSEKKHSKKCTESKNEKPTPEELSAYFTEKQHLSSEAEKFYNYFESNGWLVGGKTPMKNWKAAANNWMLNSQQFTFNKSKPASNQKHPAGKLHAETNKNYNEPL